MKKNLWKRIISFLLVVCMVLCEKQVMVFAAEDTFYIPDEPSENTVSGGNDIEKEDIGEDISEGDLQVKEPEITNAGEIEVDSFETLKAALESGNDTTIKLTQDITYVDPQNDTVECAITVSSGKHTVDFNGKTMHFTVGGSTGGANSYPFLFQDNTEITFTDTSGDKGSLYMEVAWEMGNGAVICSQHGKVTVENISVKTAGSHRTRFLETYSSEATIRNCEIDAAGYAFYLTGGTSMITNCEVTSCGDRAIYGDGGSVTIDGGSYRNVATDTDIYGKTIETKKTGLTIRDGFFYSQKSDVLEANGVGTTRICGGTFQADTGNGLVFRMDTTESESLKIYAADITVPAGRGLLDVSDMHGEYANWLGSLCDYIPPSSKVSVGTEEMTRSDLEDTLWLNSREGKTSCRIKDGRSDPAYQITDVEVTIPDNIDGKKPSQITITTPTEDVKICSVTWRYYFLGNDMGVVNPDTAFSDFYDYLAIIRLTSDTKFFPDGDKVERIVKINGISTTDYYVEDGDMIITAVYESPNRVTEMSLTVIPPEVDKDMPVQVSCSSDLYNSKRLSEAVWVNKEEKADKDMIYYLSVPMELLSSDRYFDEEDNLTIHVNEGQPDVWQPVSVEVQRTANRRLNVIIGMKPVNRYTISVDGGYAMDDKGRKIADALEGQIVYLTAYKEGTQVFDKWEGMDHLVSAGNFTQKAFDSSMQIVALLAHPKVFMGSEPMQVTALYKEASASLIGKVDFSNSGFYDDYPIGDFVKENSEDYSISRCLVEKINGDGTLTEVSGYFREEEEYVVTLYLTAFQSATAVGRSFFSQNEQTNLSSARTIIGTIDGNPIASSGKITEKGVVYAYVKCYMGHPSYRLLTENGAQAFDDGGREIAGSIPGKAVTLKAPETWNGKTFRYWSFYLLSEGSKQEAVTTDSMKVIRGTVYDRELTLLMPELGIAAVPIYAADAQMITSLTLQGFKAPQAGKNLYDMPDFQVTEHVEETQVYWFYVKDEVDYTRIGGDLEKIVEGEIGEEEIKAQYGRHYGVMLNISLEKNYYLPLGHDKIELTGMDKMPDLIYSRGNSVYVFYDFGYLAPEGLWIQPIEEQVYTGQPIKPALVVLCDGILLKEGRDYTTSYKNNTKAAEASTNKAPAVTVTGKKNYKGKITQNFTIAPAVFGSTEGITAEDIVVTYSGKQIFGKPVIKYNGKTVPASEYTVEYEGSSDLNAFNKPGSYNIKVTGKNINFRGSLLVKEKVTEKLTAKNLKCDVKQVMYTGSPIEFSAAECQVISLDSGKNLKRGTDYTVSYSNNQNKGTATMTITGTGNYSGVVKKTFTILPAELAVKEKDKSVTLKVTVKNSVEGKEFTYKRGGVKPRGYSLWYNGRMLTEGTDYTISYKNNQNTAAWTDAKAPILSITGRGNFKGSFSVKYSIVAASLNDVAGSGKAPDICYRDVKNNYVTKFSLCDKQGKALTRGKELEKEAEYFYYDTATSSYKKVTEDRVTIPEGEDRLQMQAVVYGKGNYKGSYTFSYGVCRYTAEQFVVEKIPDKTYTGSAITLDKAELVVKNRTTKEILTAGTDYSVSYENNKKCGTATVVIKGLGPYGGEIKKTFRIKTTVLAVQNKDGSQTIGDGIVIQTPPASVKYNGKEQKPGDFAVAFRGTLLKEGTDFTVSYKNNRNAQKYIPGKGNTKTPAVILTGKGNFSGRLVVYFGIEKASLDEKDVKGSFLYAAEAKDVFYKDVKGNYKTQITLTAPDGTKLRPGVDYEKDVSYFEVTSDKTCTPITADRISMGDKKEVNVLARVTGKGNYKGEIEVMYRLYRLDLKTATVEKIAACEYTGRPVCPKVKVTFGKEKKVLTEGVDYRVMYFNNQETGTATVVVKGIGEYGGEKKVTFKIVSHEMKWYNSIVEKMKEQYCL